MSTQTSINEKIENLKNLSNSKKIGIASAILLIVITIFVSFVYINKPNYEVLFSQLRGEDPSVVKSKLDDLKIDYQIEESNDGTITILVPESQKARARVEVSASFNPTGGTVGYEVLDEISFGETEKDREQKRKIALEGELVKTLERLPSINWARIHLDLPEKTILKISEDDNSDQASASVTLSLDKSQEITKVQIKGIAKMIANSVPGLNPENVVIIDENMVSLSEGIFGDSLNNDYSYGDNSKIQQNQEKELTNKTKRLLETIVGNGNVAVEVDTEMNFDVSEVVESKFGKSSPISEKTIEKENNTSQGPNIVPGADTNSDTEDYTTGSDSQSQRETYIETLTNYETEKTTSKTLKNGGEIKRLTISVVVNENALKDENGTVDQKIKDELLENAKKAVGFDENRNDEIQFTVIPFKEQPVEDRTIISIARDFSKPISSIIIVVAGFGLLAFLTKKAYDILSHSKVIQITARTSEEFQDMKDLSSGKTKSLSEEEDDDDDFMNVFNQKDINEKRIDKIIDTDPEQVRKILRYYKKDLD